MELFHKYRLRPFDFFSAEKVIKSLTNYYFPGPDKDLPFL